MCAATNTTDFKEMQLKLKSYTNSLRYMHYAMVLGDQASRVTGERNMCSLDAQSIVACVHFSHTNVSLILMYSTCSWHVGSSSITNHKLLHVSQI